MSNIDVIAMAIRNLFKRKLRTFLTILGVVVGASAIIIMISLGIAMNESFDKQMDNMGDMTVINVNNPNYYSYDATTAYNSKSTELNDKVVEQLRHLKGIKTVTPTLNVNVRFISGKYIADTSIYGIEPAAMKEFTFNLEEGRLLDDDDGTKFSAVFGGEVPYSFYRPNDRSMQMMGGGNPEEREPPKVSVMHDRLQMTYDFNYGMKTPNDAGTVKKVKPYTVEAVGLLKSGSYDTDYRIYMPIKQVQKIITEKTNYEKSQSPGARQQNTPKGYQEVMAKCQSIDDVLPVKEEIEKMGFSAYTQMDWIKSMQEVSNSLQAMLGAVGAVSLFIAAIGITNTMIMSIYERTREIGVMKVIGADIKDIKKIFLVEATTIGFVGGLIGIGFSLIISVVLNNSKILFLSSMSFSQMEKVSSIPVELCVAALVFSSIIGLVSGYFPARRAMKLSALSAIRTE